MIQDYRPTILMHQYPKLANTDYIGLWNNHSSSKPHFLYLASSASDEDSCLLRVLCPVSKPHLKLPP